MSVNTEFSNYYNNLNKSINQKEDILVSNKINNNLSKLGEINKTERVALPLFAKDGTIDLDMGAIGLIQRPIRGFIQRNLYPSISSFDESIDHLYSFTLYVKNYFKQNTPKPKESTELQSRLNEAIKGLEKLQFYYHEQSNTHHEEAIKDSIKNLRITTEVVNKNTQLLSKGDIKDRIDLILSSQVLKEQNRFDALESVINHDFKGALSLQSQDVQKFFKNSIFASSEKNSSLFLTTIILLQRDNQENQKNLLKIFTDINEIDSLPLETKVKKSIEFNLLESSGLFKPFIEARSRRKLDKAVKVTRKKEEFKSDHIAKATLKLLAGGGLAALAWKYPKFKGALPYVINFALSAYSDTQLYWQSTSKEEKLLIIQDIEALYNLEKKSPGTILKLLQETVDKRTKEGNEEMKAVNTILEAVKSNLGQPSDQQNNPNA